MKATEAKDYSRTTPVRDAGIEALVKEIRAFASYFCALALGREHDPTLGMAFHDLRELKVEVAYLGFIQIVAARLWVRSLST